MARPKKEGLDYFPLDVDIDQNDKVALIEAKHGLIGFSVVIKLFMKIYKEGYFYKWTEKEQLLFSKRINVDINSVREIVNDCIEWELFSGYLFEHYEILTSDGVQKRYLDAITRRKEVTFQKEYLLIDPVDFIGNSKIAVFIVNTDGNKINVNINSINANKQKQQDDNNPQSKVKESKVKESKVKNLKDKEDDEASSDPFENIENENHQKSIIDMLIKNNLIPPYGITETLTEDIRDVFDNFGFIDPHKVIEHAIKDCVRGNGRTWKFVYNRLNDWAKQGIKTVDDAIRLQEKEQFGRQQNKWKQGYAPKSKEVLPDWFDQQQQPKQPTQPDEQKKNEIDEMLKKLKASGG